MTDPARSYTLPNADVRWDQGTAEAPQFGDIYWNRNGALAEKSHVFIDKTDFAKRAPAADRFTLVETGFGFGHNFLLAADAWLQHSRAGCLHFFSIENRPVAREQLRAYLKDFQQPLAGWLRDHYPPAVKGHHVYWYNNTVCLHLLFDDVENALDSLVADVDGWFLDGFNPKSNPDMWQPALFAAMAKRSRPGATLSTYTAAGDVRRGLTAAGFTMQRVPGFAGKAEMLSGTLPGTWQPQRIEHGHTIVIGDGIAGESVARALRKRGEEVTVLASGRERASDIPALSVWPQLTAAPQDRSLYSLSAANYCRTHVENFNPLALRFSSADPTRRERMAGIARLLPDDIAMIDGSDVVFPQAGWLVSTGYADQHRDVQQLEQTAGGWLVKFTDGTSLPCTRVIVAAGIGSQRLLPLSLKAIRGQVVALSTTTTINEILTGDISLIPVAKDTLIAGSTYHLDNDHWSTDDLDTRELKTRSAAVLGYPPDIDGAYAGVRAATRDRLPLVGAVPDPDALADHCQRHAQLPFTTFRTGLFASTAFGSRAATHAPLAGELIAASLFSEPLPVTARQAAMLSLARFTLRDARRAPSNRQTSAR